MVFRLENRQTIRSLTSLKGIFIWIIVLHNTFLLDTVLDHLPGMPFIRLFGGSLGNSMFFMLSGFLMAIGYREKIAQRQISFEDFLCRRLKKLYPMYALSNIAALLLNVWQYGISAVNLKKIAFTFLLMQGGGLEAGNPYNSPTWFVSALMVCYVVYFAGACLTKNKTAYRVMLVTGVGIGYYLCSAEWNVPACYPGNGVAYLNFFLGCILAEVYPQIKNCRSLLKPACVFAVAGSLYLMMRYGVEVISGGSATAFSFVICPMVLYLAYEEGLCRRVLEWKPLLYLGNISMGVFYWHLVLYMAMRFALGGMTVTRYGAFVLLLLVVSIATERVTGKKKTAMKP